LVETETAIVDGDAGTLDAEPDEDALALACAAIVARRAAAAAAAAQRRLPAVTVDGRAVRLLCNAATAAEVTAGIEAGAEGVGLLRTELAFLDARAWPSEDDHAAALAPVLAPLDGRLATVRTLDFGADKTPPFL